MIKKLCYVLTGRQKRGMLLLLAGLIVCALLDTAAVALMMPFMSAVVDPTYISESKWLLLAYRTFHCQSSSAFLSLFALLLGVVYLFRGALRYFVNYQQAHFSARCRSNVLQRLFSFVMQQPYSYHVRQNSAQTLRLITSDVDGMFAMINQYLLLGSSLCVSAGILIVLLSTDAVLTVYAIVLIALIVLLPSRAIKKRIKRSANQNFSALTKSLKWSQQALGGLKEIMVKRREQYFIDRYAAAAQDAATATGDYNAWVALPKAFVETACMVAIFVLMNITLSRNEGSSMIALFATFALAATRLVPVVNQVLETMNASTYYKPQVDAVYKVFSQNRGALTGELRHPCSETERIHHTEAVSALREGIAVERLYFRFEEAEEDLFTNLSLQIEAGKSTAFVGTTGSGKTTLADIILGLQKPRAGAVLADGRNIAESPDWWADMIGYIPQFIYLCDDTIRANVAFGIPSEEVDDERVRKCLQDAQLLAFVESLPDGLDTMTGENGARLSGGQRQRIGIARALYTDPKVLVMDEATSALDGETEKAIVDALNLLSGEKTLLIIAHRLSAIQGCHRIYRIENGTASIEK